MALLLIIIFLTTTGRADIQLDGYFIARDNCEAFLSVRKETNPGDIHLTVDMAYEVMAKNKTDASHYRIKVKNATPIERWAPVSCGTLLTDCRVQTAATPPHPVPSVNPVTPSLPADGRDYLLALSWQPAFCQSNQQKIECRKQTADRYDAGHLTLHGLWPQPRENIYCNVGANDKKLDKRKMWDQLPALGLTDKTYDDLIETMPGVVSYLHRHEWIKHGACYSTTPEEYFRESIMLIDQVNASEVRDFIVANIGRTITAGDIKAKFDAAFGSGAGGKVRIKCSEGMISEIWINLNGEIELGTSLTDLLKNADQASPSCKSGIVDPVGF